MAKKRSWLPIVAGIGVLLLFLVVAGLFVLASLVRDRVEIDRSHTSETVGDEFDRVRERFADPAPMLTFDGEVPRLSDEARTRTSDARLESLHVLAWDPRDAQLARFSLPFWLLRLQSKPFRIGDVVSSFESDALQITVEDIERFGPGVVLDYVDGRGARALIWTQ